MAQTKTNHNEIAKRYGGVLFELAQENNLLEKVLKDARHLLSCLHQDPWAWRFVSSPVISLEEQREVVKKIGKALNVEKLTFRFLAVVGYHHRLSCMPAILEEFIARSRSAAGLVEGTLETAVPLSPKTLEKLKKSLSQHLGKEVTLESYVKKSLLGGVILRMGSFMVDASLETRLNKLRDMMKD